MHLILCVDDRDGIHFAGKRLSSDSVLSEFLLQYTQGSKLWMNHYSAKLFVDAEIVADEDFFLKAKTGEYCFLENTPIPEDSQFESITLCLWNRKYPSTEKFDREMLKAMHLETRFDFPGNSHEKLTIERYIP